MSRILVADHSDSIHLLPNHSGSGDDLDLEAKLRLDEDLSSVSSESEDSLEAQYAEIVAAVARHHRESFPKFQADFAKVFGISRE